MNKETFAERLKRLRKENNFTQKQLAAITEISLQTIRNYEQKNSEPISIYLLKLAQSLDVTPEYLLKGDNDVNNYTEAIKLELQQLESYEQIQTIYAEEFNASILSHLEMTDSLITEIRDVWLSKKIFVRQDENNHTIPSYCTRAFVCGVVLRYTQNRKKYKQAYSLKDGMLLRVEQLE